MLAISYLMASKASSNALGPNSYVLEWILWDGSFLISASSLSGLLSLGNYWTDPTHKKSSTKDYHLYPCIWLLMSNQMRSWMISTCSQCGQCHWWLWYCHINIIIVCHFPLILQFSSGAETINLDYVMECLWINVLQVEIWHSASNCSEGVV